jgi:glycosyltransferase involved in cell wall biosynthesis
VISVALCTHNGEEFLAAQLESILDQTLPPDEIVLSDDASTDSTVALAESIVAEHAGRTVLRVLRNSPALGVARNFQQAVTATRGDLIALSDQDDVWYPQRLERMAAVFDARPDLLLLHGDARLVDGAGEPIGPTVFEAIEASPWERSTIHAGRAFDVLIRRNLAVGATTIFRRGLLELAVPFADGWIHDEWLAIVAAASGEGAVDFVDEPLVAYRQHGRNQIGARKLSFSGKVGRVMEPRRTRNARLLSAFTGLSERVEALPVSAHVLERSREKLAHERVRSALPAARVRRIVPVLREARSGRYATCGRGWADVLRDLVQPVD